MGDCYEKMGRYPDAVSKFNKVLEIQPSPVEAMMKKNWLLKKIKNEKYHFFKLRAAIFFYAACTI
jgi:tetratricopeptide (TPR) repeat protein